MRDGVVLDELLISRNPLWFVHPCIRNDMVLVVDGLAGLRALVVEVLDGCGVVLGDDGLLMNQKVFKRSCISIIM